LNTKDRMKLLKEWEAQFRIVDEAWTSLEKIFRGLDCDSEIGKAMWDTFSKYTKAMSSQIGDSGEWLYWYCWENDMGLRMMEAKAAAWKKMRKIVNLEVLCRLIEADIVC
jgi:hypothetical protein